MSQPVAVRGQRPRERGAGPACPTAAAVDHTGNLREPLARTTRQRLLGSLSGRSAEEFGDRLPLRRGRTTTSEDARLCSQASGVTKDADPGAGIATGSRELRQTGHVTLEATAIKIRPSLEADVDGWLDLLDLKQAIPGVGGEFRGWYVLLRRRWRVGGVDGRIEP